MAETGALELLRPELAELSAYVPVQGQFAVRLDANEAPALLSQAARSRLADAAASTAWERYPDARASELRAAIAKRAGVTPEHVLAGVGSDEIITLLSTALTRPRIDGQPATVLTTTPTFVMYRMSARARGLRVIEVPLDESWDLATASLARAIQMSPPNIVFVASPNNPTGRLASRDRLIELIGAAQGALVVIDEAYVDYADRNQLDLCQKYENVAILRTLSKVGFAALRVGWLIASPALVAELDKTRLPYNIATPCQRLATLVLSELAQEIENTTREVCAERERLAKLVAALEGITVTPSDANFLWLRTSRPAGEVWSGLAERGVLVRSFHSRGGRLLNQLRVTIGTRAENEAFLQALREVI